LALKSDEFRQAMRYVSREPEPFIEHLIYIAWLDVRKKLFDVEIKDSGFTNM
jgi:hypothetical protein